MGVGVGLAAGADPHSRTRRTRGHAPQPSHRIARHVRCEPNEHEILRLARPARGGADTAASHRRKTCGRAPVRSRARAKSRRMAQAARCDLPGIGGKRVEQRVDAIGRHRDVRNRSDEANDADHIRTSMPVNRTAPSPYRPSRLKMRRLRPLASKGRPPDGFSAWPLDGDLAWPQRAICGAFTPPRNFRHALLSIGSSPPLITWPPALLLTHKE